MPRHDQAHDEGAEDCGDTDSLGHVCREKDAYEDDPEPNGRYLADLVIRS